MRWLRLTPDRVVPGLLALEGILLLAERFGWFTFDRHKGYAPLLAIAAVAATMALMLLWFLVALVFRRRFQFSLRSLLLLVLVVAIPCSWLSVEMKAARKQHAIVEAIQSLGGQVTYDHQDIDPFRSSFNIIPPVPPGPAWLRERLGVDLLANVAAARLAKGRLDIGDAELEYIRELTQLQVLSLNGTKVSEAGLEKLKGLTQLQFLDLSDTNVGDAGMEHLKALTQLSELHLDGTKISNVGMEYLSELTQLDFLELAGTKVGDAGLEHLKRLTQLQWLNLAGTKVGDAGLEHLKGLRQLEELNLCGTNVSDAGVRRLQMVLPNMHIQRDSQGQPARAILINPR